MHNLVLRDLGEIVEVVVDLSLIPPVGALEVLVHHVLLPVDLEAGVELFVDGADGVAEFVGHHARELSVGGLVVEPAEVHGWAVLVGHVLTVLADQRPGAGGLAGRVLVDERDPDLSWGGAFDELEFDVGKL